MRAQDSIKVNLHYAHNSAADSSTAFASDQYYFISGPVRNEFIPARLAR